MTTTPIDWAELETRMAARRAEQAERLLQLRAIALATLRAAGAKEVTAMYEGYADSGGIESLSVKGADFDLDLDSIELEFRDPGATTTTSTDAPTRRMTLARILEWIFMDTVCLDFAGWENNDGGRGDICWDVDTDRITLEHTTFSTESSTETREY